jgi:hypothetical protein
MSRFRGLLLVVALAVVAAAVLPAVARADMIVAKSGSFSYTSEPGDYVGQGGSATYTVPKAYVQSYGTPGQVRVYVTTAAGDWWDLDLAAPQGQALTPGTYTGAERFPFALPTNPSLDVFSQGRGCNELTGSFTIKSISQGPYGYLQSLDATFEQHCEGAAPALRGRIVIANPSAPRPLTVGATVDSAGRYDTGLLLLRGKVSCSADGWVLVQGTATQGAATGYVDADVYCKGGHADWTATVIPDDLTVPFVRGPLTVSLTVSGFDEWFSNYTQTPIYPTSTLAKTLTAKPR